MILGQKCPHPKSGSGSLGALLIALGLSVGAAVIGGSVMLSVHNSGKRADINGVLTSFHASTLLTLQSPITATYFRSRLDPALAPSRSTDDSARWDCLRSNGTNCSRFSGFLPFVFTGQEDLFQNFGMTGKGCAEGTPGCEFKRTLEFRLAESSSSPCTASTRDSCDLCRADSCGRIELRFRTQYIGSAINPQPMRESTVSLPARSIVSSTHIDYSLCQDPPQPTAARSLVGIDIGFRRALCGTPLTSTCSSPGNFIVNLLKTPAANCSAPTNRDCEAGQYLGILGLQSSSCASIEAFSATYWGDWTLVSQEWQPCSTTNVAGQVVCGEGINGGIQYHYSTYKRSCLEHNSNKVLEAASCAHIGTPKAHERQIFPSADPTVMNHTARRVDRDRSRHCWKWGSWAKHSTSSGTCSQNCGTGWQANWENQQRTCDLIHVEGSTTDVANCTNTCGGGSQQSISLEATNCNAVACSITLSQNTACNERCNTPKADPPGSCKGEWGCTDARGECKNLGGTFATTKTYVWPTNPPHKTVQYDFTCKGSGTENFTTTIPAGAKKGQISPYWK